MLVVSVADLQWITLRYRCVVALHVKVKPLLKAVFGAVHWFAAVAVIAVVEPKSRHAATSAISEELLLKHIHASVAPELNVIVPPETREVGEAVKTTAPTLPTARSTATALLTVSEALVQWMTLKYFCVVSAHTKDQSLAGVHCLVDGRSAPVTATLVESGPPQVAAFLATPAVVIV
jgi:hypothetical protein